MDFDLPICSVRVSNELGLGHPQAAKYSVYVTVFQSLLIGLLCMVAILMTKDYFAIIFTSSKKLQEAASHLAFLLGATMVLNSIQPVISGTPFLVVARYYSGKSNDKLFKTL